MHLNLNPKGSPPADVRRSVARVRSVAFLAIAALVMTLGACSGGGSDSASAVLGGALGASIDDSLGRSPLNVINGETAGLVEVLVDMPADSRSGDEVTVVLSDGANQVTLTIPAVDGGGILPVGPIDASVLADGPIEVSVTVTRGTESIETPFGSLATKDTLAPALALSVELPATPSNPTDVVNLNNQAALVVTATFDAGADPADLATVFVSDGATVVQSLTENVVPGGSVTFAAFDVTGLGDGPLDVTVRIQDAAENDADLLASFTKDTVLPALAFAGVQAGPNNGVDQISLSSHESVVIDGSLDSGEAATDTIAARFTDWMGATVESQPLPAPQGGGAFSFVDFDVSQLADGALTLDIVIRDDNGNELVAPATPATMDASLSAVASATIDAPMDASRTATLAGSNVSGVRVDFDWNGPSLAGETLEFSFVSVVDGSTVTTLPQPVTAGLEFERFGSFDLSSLPDGNVDWSWIQRDAFGNVLETRGGGLRIDREAHAGHERAFVASTAGNPESVINSTVAGNVRVDVELRPHSGDEVSVFARLGDGFTTVVSSAQTAPALGGTMSFTGLDCSGLADGAINLEIVYTDSLGNVQAQSGAATLKDTMVPAPVAAFVAAGGTNPDNFVNAASQGAATVRVTLPATSSIYDTYALSIGDGVTSVAVAPQNAPQGGGTMTFAGIDLSGLQDGPLGISVMGSDANGNQNVFVGTQATKDVVAPGVASGFVAAGPGNADHEINSSNQDDPNMAVRFRDVGEGDTVSFSFTGPNGVSVQSSAQPLFNQGEFNWAGKAGVGVRNLADGNVQPRILVMDPAGNGGAFPATPATKTTTALMPTAASVQSGANNAADVINAASVSAVSVDVVMPSGATTADMVTVRLYSGATTVSSSPTAAPMGGGTMNFVFDASSLSEGSVRVEVLVANPAYQTSSFDGTPALKDTVAPERGVFLAVQWNEAEYAGWINAQLASDLDLTVGVQGPNDGTDSLELVITDGVGNVTPPSATVPSVGDVAFSGLDLTSLADGAINAMVTLRDAAGNGTTTTVPVGTKDTQIPDAVSALRVAMGNRNAENVVNAANADSAVVDFRSGSDATVGDRIEIRFVDGNSVSMSFDGTIANPGMLEVAGSFDLSAMADGNLEISGTVFDRAGNRSPITSVIVLKDTAAPAPATAAVVPSGASNPANFVNAATENSVDVDVTVPAGSVATDEIVVYLSDGSTTVESARFPALAGAGTVTVTGIDASSLAEGSINVVARIFDLGGNDSGNFTGTAATKDVTAPSDPIVDPTTTPWASLTQQFTGAADASIAIEIDGGSAQATGNADANGFFGIVVSLNAGVTNNLTVRARDAAGNPSNDITVDFNGAGLSVAHNAAAPPAPFSDGTLAALLGDTGNVDGGAFADIDADGDLDLFVAVSGGGILYENVAGVFTDITLGAGVTFAGDRCAIWGDYDNDGDADLLTVDSTGGTTLYANQWFPSSTRTFVDVTVAEGAGVASTTLTQAFWLDHDRDGWLDFVVLDANTVNGNVVMVNQRGAMSPMNAFAVEAATGAEAGITAPRSGAVADFDVDGDIDLLFGDAAPGVFYTRDMGGYTDVAGMMAGEVNFDHSAGAAPIVFVDYDNDGDLDVFIARGGALSVNQLWRNDGASFTEVAASAGLDADVMADDVCWGDIDNDGLIDLYVGSDGVNRFYLNQGDIDMDNVMEFVEIAAAAGMSIDDAGDADMVQMADVDGDGDLDLFVGNEGSANVLFRNDLNNFRFLKVRLVGQGGGNSSLDALGAVVTLRDDVGNVLATREVNGGRGKGSQDCAEVHFGGIAPSRSYQVEVSFPSGATVMQNVTPRLEANQTVTINE